MHAQCFSQDFVVFHVITWLQTEEVEVMEVEVMEDVKSQNEQLEFLLAENQLLKQHTQKQEEQVAEITKKLEGNDYLRIKRRAHSTTLLHFAHASISICISSSELLLICREACCVECALLVCVLCQLTSASIQPYIC